MSEFDAFQRARLAYDRFKWLSVVSGGSIVFLVGFLDKLQSYQVSHTSLVLGVVGLAFTLFISIGVQMLASAADRWDVDTVSPLLLVWEWRLLALALLSFLISIILLVTYLLNNIRII